VDPLQPHAVAAGATLRLGEYDLQVNERAPAGWFSVDLLDLAILALRILLVALLYLFLGLVLRFASRSLRPQPAPRHELRLEVVDAGSAALAPGDVIDVADGAVLGRTERADLVVSDATVSVEHARVRRVGRVWVVTDLGSTNGTHINDSPVNGEAPLAAGDVLRLGNVRLKVVRAEPPTAPYWFHRGIVGMHESNGEQSTLQLIVDQLEELVVTIIEEIRERPGVAAAILAAVVGIVVGSMLAAGVGRRHASPPARVVVQKARTVSEAGDLAGLAIRLLQNPIVRSYLRSALESQLKKRFSL
jgi:hypothetical protein